MAPSEQVVTLALRECLPEFIAGFRKTNPLAKIISENLDVDRADLTMHFSPRRTSNVIEVAAYERFKRPDGRGYSYTFSQRVLDLIWDGAVFQTRAPASKKLSDADNNNQTA